MRLDEKGDRLWQKTYGGNDFEALDALSMTSNHELVMAGVSFSFNDSLQGDVYVVKTDMAGEVVWEKTFGDYNFPERCWGMDTTADGGFVLTGAEGFVFGGQDIFVMKITGDGEFVWKKTFGNDQNDDNAYPRVRCLKNGDILLTTALRPNSDNRAHAYIARLSSSSGDTIWEKYYPGAEWHSWFGFATELPDGTLVNAGAVMEFEPFINNYSVLGALTKTDAEGNLLWQRKYYTRHDNNNYFFCMTPTFDAGFLMGGFAYRDGNNRQDAWAVKVDSLGCLEPGCAGGVAAPEPGAATAGLRVWPNPASSWLTVESEENILLGLRLSDLSGRVLEDVQFFRQHGVREYRLSLAALPPGVYVLSVRTDKGWVSEKVVKIE